MIGGGGLASVCDGAGSGCNGSGAPMVALGVEEGGAGFRLGTGTLGGRGGGASMAGSGETVGAGASGLSAQAASSAVASRSVARRRPGHVMAGRVVNRCRAVKAQSTGRCCLREKRAPPTMAPGVGFEPTTDRLTADCSTAELPRNGRCAVERPRVIATSPRGTKIFFCHARRVRDAWLDGSAFLSKPVASSERKTARSVARGRANRVNRGYWP